MSVQPVVAKNQLLSALGRRERELFLADCVQVKLQFGTVLHDAGDPIRYVYFPDACIISLLTTVDTHSVLEVGMVGNEGMCGQAAILGATIEPLRALVQGTGPAWRLGIAAFRRHLEALPGLRQLLHLYAGVLFRQLVQTAACTRFHVVEARLARWLLMSQDRAQADSFAVTQEFLAYMLGVRRAGVTKAAGVLQAMRLIHYSRGQLTILDRAQLEQAACACYRDDLQTYTQGLEALPREAKSAPTASVR